MNKMIIRLAIIATIVVSLLALGGMLIGVSNKEAMLRTTIEAKQLDNTSEMDNMTKKILQVAQVSEKQLDALKDIFVSYADARTSDNAGQIMNWVQEAIPNVDTSTLNNLQNIITSSRDAWTMRQKELVDLSREHTIMLRTFPDSLILSILGRKPVKITIVTSTRTTKAFETGKDDDVDVFQKRDANVEKK